MRVIKDAMEPPFRKSRRFTSETCVSLFMILTPGQARPGKLFTMPDCGILTTRFSGSDLLEAVVFGAADVCHQIILVEHDHNDGAPEHLMKSGKPQVNRTKIFIDPDLTAGESAAISFRKLRRATENAVGFAKNFAHFVLGGGSELYSGEIRAGEGGAIVGEAAGSRVRVEGSVLKLDKQRTRKNFAGTLNDLGVAVEFEGTLCAGLGGFGFGVAVKRAAFFGRGFAEDERAGVREGMFLGGRLFRCGRAAGEGEQAEKE